MTAQKRKCEHRERHTQREDDVKTQGEHHLQARECLRLPEARGEAGKCSPSQPSEGTSPVTLSSWISALQL